jgi:quinol monooxygenase YgiN
MPYVVAVKWIARAGEEEEVARCARALIEPTRREPGNLMYQAHRDPADPRVIYIYEQYVDEAGYQAHLDSAHVQALGFGDAIPRLEARHREFYAPIDP